MRPRAKGDPPLVTDLFDVVPAASRARPRPQAQPEWVPPMLATLSHEPFSDPDWVFETKLDGIRALAFRRGERVRLLSRNREPLNNSYPELVDALGGEPMDDFVVDGEIVAFEGRRTSFARLQRRMQIKDPVRARASGVRVYLYVFDLLHVAGCDTTGLPLTDRKRLLRRALGFRGPLRYTTHRPTKGQEYLAEACERGLEGVMAKRADSVYRHDRSTDWLKLKCIARQEFVVVGYTDPKGSRAGFGALLVGYHVDGNLVFAGKVGTGYGQRTLRELADRLAALERPDPPFAPQLGLPRAGVHWVRPDLVAEIAFTEWTNDGKLRHPRYIGLRSDKPASQVVREAPP
jgi:bifunctional non-homologous end joining protein LigD